MSRKPDAGLNYYRFYTNIAIFILSFLVAVLLFQNQSFHEMLLGLGKLEYLGAFIAGMFVVTTFAVVPSTVVLIILTESLHILPVALIAGLGAMTGDFILFQFVKNDGVADDIMTIFKQYGGKRVTHIFRSKYFHWTLPIVGALIVISPLPDEIGVSLMGISKMNSYKFLVLSYLLNTVGIFVLLSASRVIR